MHPHPSGAHPLYGYGFETRTATCRACYVSELDLLPEEAGPWHAGHQRSCQGSPERGPEAVVLSFGTKPQTIL